MSQQKLADLAGIERKQLSILENGGSVTLRTIRKVLPHLPNIQTFTIGEASGTVGRSLSPETQAEIARAAGEALGLVLQKLFKPLREGRLPAEEDASLADEAGRQLYRAMGYSDEEYDQAAEQMAKDHPERQLTEEETAAAWAEVAEVMKKADEVFGQLELDEETDGADAVGKEEEEEPPAAE